MKHSFEKKLTTYHDAVKESFKDFSKEGREKSKQQKQELTSGFARADHTNLDAEAQVYDLQKKKVERLNKFKKFLHKTRGENGSFIHPEIEPGLPVVMSDGQGGYQVKNEHGEVRSLTKGELLTDHEWGLEYTFDASVSIHDIRSYYLEQVKTDLREHLDKQIITSEVANEWGDTGKQKAYQEIGKRIEQGSEQQGIIAEKMVKNFLKKLAITGNTDFEIVEANAFQDVEQKVDFIIHRKSIDRSRGAQVIESDHATDIGIQFTVNTEKTAFKEEQIAKAKKRTSDFQDIVLVTLPAHDASMLYKKWAHRKTPGGPDALWDATVREKIFRGVMSKVLTEEEVNAFCEANFSEATKS